MAEGSDEKGSFGANIVSKFRDGTRPKFLGGKSEGGDTPAGLKAKDEKSAAAAAGLASAENAATAENLEQSEDSLSGTRQKEQQAGGLYTGGGKSADDNTKTKNKKGIKGFLSKRAPFLLLLGSVFGIGGIMGGTQMFQPFSLVAQFQESFNSMHTSASTRSNIFFNKQMNSNGRVKNPIRGKIFGADTFKITNKQATKLAQQGIEYDDDYNGYRVLKFDDGTGDIKIVTADVDTAKAIGGNAVDFKTVYAENPDFFNGYNKGSMTWRGAIANWFSKVTAKFLASNNITRNLFQDFQKKVAASESGNTKTVAQELISNKTNDIEDGGVATKPLQEETTENGETVVKDLDSEEVGKINAYDKNTGSNVIYKVDDAAELPSPSKSTIRRSGLTADTIRTKLDDISGKVQKGANIACTIMNTLGAISLLVTAAEALQIINLTTAYFESVDKTKAGYGDETPIHDLTNALNDKVKNSNDVIKRSDNNWDYSNEENNFSEGKLNTIKTETVISEKTAMQSDGIAALYSGGQVDPNNASVQSFNFTNSIKRIAGGVGTSMAAFTGCSIAKLASNAVSGTTTAVLIAGCILSALGAPFTLGMTAATAATTCGGLATKFIAGAAFSVGLGIVVAGVVSAITPSVTKVLTRDLVSNLGGEDLGNALTSGANMYQGNAHRANGGSLATIEEYKSFAIARNQVIAENAKFERQTLSPFDLTSKNTFLGVLMTQFMNFLTVDSLMSTITTSSSVVSSSLLALGPTASAYDIASELPENIEEYEKTCPYLASIGAIGDAYCNPYSITDMSTMGMDPLDVIDILDKEGNFEDTDSSDGNVRINKKSGLAKYIVYCDNRQSSFGIADNNIANSVANFSNVSTGSSLFNTTANAAIGAIPVFGDATDVINNAKQLQNIGYISGQSCVAGNDVMGEYEENVEDGHRRDDYAKQSPDWNTTAKYYQRFIEDQSLAESMGLIEESAVSAFLDDYYKENPLDNSYEGMLARKSGMTKDQVIALLDLIDIANYIAEYNPSTRYAFGEPAIKPNNEIQFNNENRLASVPTLLSQIIYADLRNRNYVV